MPIITILLQVLRKDINKTNNKKKAKMEAQIKLLEVQPI